MNHILYDGGESREAYGRRFTFDPPEFLFEINAHMTQFLQKPTFDPVRTNEGGSKLSFRTVWKRIKIRFSNKLSHVIINFDEKLGWIKSESACICSTWLTSSHILLDQNLDPLVLLSLNPFHQNQTMSLWVPELGWDTYAGNFKDDKFWLAEVEIYWKRPILAILGVQTFLWVWKMIIENLEFTTLIIKFFFETNFLLKKKRII